MLTWFWQWDSRRPTAGRPALTVIERKNRIWVRPGITHDEAMDHAKLSRVRRKAADVARDLGQKLRDRIAAIEDDRVTNYYPATPERTDADNDIERLRGQLLESLNRMAEVPVQEANLLGLEPAEVFSSKDAAMSASDAVAADAANDLATQLGRLARISADLGRKSSGGRRKEPRAQRNEQSRTLVSNVRELGLRDESSVWRRIAEIIVDQTRSRYTGAGRMPLSAGGNGARRAAAIASWLKHFKNVRESMQRQG